MKRYRRLMMLMLILLSALAAVPWGIDQSYAVPVLTPGVDYTKPNFAYSPPLRKFVDSLAGVGAGARPAGTALGASTLGQYMPVAQPNVGERFRASQTMTITSSLWSNTRSSCTAIFPLPAPYFEVMCKSCRRVRRAPFRSPLRTVLPRMPWTIQALSSTAQTSRITWGP